jgi:hypothetical protein
MRKNIDVLSQKLSLVFGASFDMVKGLFALASGDYDKTEELVTCLCEYDPHVIQFQMI